VCGAVVLLLSVDKVTRTGLKLGSLLKAVALWGAREKWTNYALISYLLFGGPSGLPRGQGGDATGRIYVCIFLCSSLQLLGS